MTNPTVAERIVAKHYNPANFRTLIAEIDIALAEARREGWEEAADLVKSWYPQARKAAKQKKHVTTSLVHALRRRSRAQEE